MIKLKDLLLEGISKKEIQDIVKKVYPHIAKALGGSPVKVEVHNNIYKRIGAIGVEDLMKQNNPSAEYDWDNRIIYLYASKMKNAEEVIKSLLHEHTHTKQSRAKFKKMYDDGKTYKNHPYENAARNSEKNWKNYLKHLDKS